MNGFGVRQVFCTELTDQSSWRLSFSFFCYERAQELYGRRFRSGACRDFAVDPAVIDIPQIVDAVVAFGEEHWSPPLDECGGEWPLRYLTSGPTSGKFVRRKSRRVLRMLGNLGILPGEF